MPANLPQDIGNQVIDAIGWQHDLGDLQEGSVEAKIILRAYSQCLRQLLRAAHWDFARKEAPLVLQADATGQTPNVGTIVPGGFAYSYQYPVDCMKVRFIPYNGQYQSVPIPQGNIVPVNGSSPTIATLNPSPIGIRQRPARYLIALDLNNPPPAGVEAADVQGVSPQGRSIICTNVQPTAYVVYTALMNYPSNWDPLFRAAFVSYLASEVALPIWASKDRKFGLEIRGQQVALAKSKIMEARATNGNESWASSDLGVDWMRARNVGTGDRGHGYDNGPGMLYGGLDDCCGVGNSGAY